MVGLLNQRVNTDDPLKHVKGYSPERVSLRPQDTVESRVAGLLSDDGKLLQLARSNARLRAGGRGLLNSSIAVGEGERAAIETALPIASQDAAQSGQFQLQNQQADIRAKEFGANAVNQAEGVHFAGQQNLREIGATGTEQRRTQSEGYQQDLGRIGATGAQTRQNIEATGVQDRRNIVAAGDQDVRSIGATGAQTRQNIEATGVQDRRNIVAAGDQDVRSIGATGAQTRQNIEATGVQDRRNIVAAGDQDVRSIDATGAQDRQTLDAQIQGESDLSAQASRQRLEELFANFGYDKIIQELRGEQAFQLEEISARSNRLIQTSQSAALAYANAAQSIGNILANHDLPVGVKEGHINHVLNVLDTSMETVHAIAGLDYNSLFGELDTSLGGSTTGGGSGRTDQDRTSTGGGTDDGGGGRTDEDNEGGDAQERRENEILLDQAKERINDVVDQHIAGTLQPEVSVPRVVQYAKTAGMTPQDLADYLGFDSLQEMMDIVNEYGGWDSDGSGGGTTGGGSSRTDQDRTSTGGGTDSGGGGRTDEDNEGGDANERRGSTHVPVTPSIIAAGKERIDDVVGQHIAGTLPPETSVPQVVNQAKAINMSPQDLADYLGFDTLDEMMAIVNQYGGW